MRNKRCDPRIRKRQILDTAIQLAHKIRYMDLTREQIAEVANVSSSLIAYYFGTIERLRRAVWQEAIRHNIVPILAQDLASANRHIDITVRKKIHSYLNAL